MEGEGASGAVLNDGNEALVIIHELKYRWHCAQIARVGFGGVEEMEDTVGVEFISAGTTGSIFIAASEEGIRSWEKKIKKNQTPSPCCRLQVGVLPSGLSREILLL